MRAKALYTFYPVGKTSAGLRIFRQVYKRDAAALVRRHGERKKKKALFIPIYIYECFMQYSSAYVTRLYDNVRGRGAWPYRPLDKCMRHS